MKTPMYESVTKFSFGEVKTELRPDSGFKDQEQALDAMLVAGHTALTAWVIDNTVDPEAHDGRQEQIKAIVQDGKRQIAEIIISVPTTLNFTKAMFERLVKETIVPKVLDAARSYPSTREAQQDKLAPKQHPLTDEILPGALQATSRVSPRQLLTR